MEVKLKAYSSLTIAPNKFYDRFLPSDPTKQDCRTHSLLVYSY